MKRAGPDAAAAPCPCGSDSTYGGCCGALHQGHDAGDAEALMRSRYSAYVHGLESYLLATWHPSTRPPRLDLAAAPRVRWLGLQVRRHRCIDAASAEVEFVARCRVGGEPATRIHELSRFVHEDGRWFYLDGVTPAT